MRDLNNLFKRLDRETTMDEQAHQRVRSCKNCGHFQHDNCTNKRLKKEMLDATLCTDWKPNF